MQINFLVREQNISWGNLLFLSHSNQNFFQKLFPHVHILLKTVRGRYKAPPLFHAATLMTERKQKYVSGTLTFS